MAHANALIMLRFLRQPSFLPANPAVSGTGLSSGNANLYADGSWARAGATLASGTNSYTATATDLNWPPRTAQDSVTVNLPATVTFTCDANGNLTGDGRRVFEYDYENQLTNVYVASAWRESMKYDAFGRKRVLQQHHWTGSAWLLTNEVRYVYDGMLVVQERHFQPQVSTNIPINTISYTRGRDLSGSLQGAGGIGGLLARTDHSAFSLQHSYFHSDGNGNITALVNTNGAVVARYQYDPYGNLLGMAGPLAEANTYRFSSKEWHANAGLYYYGFRYYEPNLQRWPNRDPIGEEGGVNLYEYVFNSPLNLIDPQGLAYGNPISGPDGPVGPPGPYLPQPILPPLPPLPPAPVLSPPSKCAGGSFYDLTSNSVGIMDLLNTGVELGAGSATIGNNFKIYPNGFRGNQYVSTRSIAGMANAAGPSLFGAGLFVDGLGYFNGDVSGEKLTVNTGVGLIGLYGGPYGAGLAAAFFLTDSFYPGGIPGAIDQYAKSLGEVRECDPHFNPRLP